MHEEPCPDLVYVAARGSGQNGWLTEPFAQGLGDRGRRVLGFLREALGRDSESLPAIAVDYPATAVGYNAAAWTPELGNYPAVYAASAELGAVRARNAVMRTALACADSQFVLFGYSQGGQVIGDAFAGLASPVRARVARVILFAEATYAAGDPQVDFRPAAVPGAGIKGRRAFFPASPGTVIESWCWVKDAVCQRPPGGTQFHGDIYDDYERAAAASAATAIRARVGTGA
ncbi:MAG TPA: cutinase family protein [Ornithinibacter sp.]|nr:cutinase family protein [Ornithinibacter sp.]